MSKRDITLIIIFLAACHAVIEDTVIFIPLGIPVQYLLLIRFGAAVLLTLAVARYLAAAGCPLCNEPSRVTGYFLDAVNGGKRDDLLIAAIGYFHPALLRIQFFDKSAQLTGAPVFHIADQDREIAVQCLQKNLVDFFERVFRQFRRAPFFLLFSPGNKASRCSGRNMRLPSQRRFLRFNTELIDHDLQSFVPG